MLLTPVTRLSNTFKDHKVWLFVALMSSVGFTSPTPAGAREFNTIRLAQESSEETGTQEYNAEDEEQNRRLNRVSNEDRTRLRRDLDNYSRALDPIHSQIEENRIIMRKRMQERFFQADRDNNQTLSRIEATEFMPQVARHFSEVDLNNDGEISMNELAVAMNKAVERQRIEEAQLAEVEQRAAEMKAAEAKSIDIKKSEMVSGKAKSLKNTDSVRKRSL